MEQELGEWDDEEFEQLAEVEQEIEPLAGVEQELGEWDVEELERLAEVERELERLAEVEQELMRLTWVEQERGVMGSLSSWLGWSRSLGSGVMGSLCGWLGLSRSLCSWLEWSKGLSNGLIGSRGLTSGRKIHHRPGASYITIFAWWVTPATNAEAGPFSERQHIWPDASGTVQPVGVLQMQSDVVNPISVHISALHIQQSPSCVAVMMVSRLWWGQSVTTERKEALS